MKSTKEFRLTRRQFAVTLAALATPAIFVGPPAQEKKAEAKKETAAQEAEDWEARALRTIREFPVREGLDPAFAFRAVWARARH